MLELTDGLKATLVDMHVHTMEASSDSMLDPNELPAIAHVAGLHGVNITEHDQAWQPGRQGSYRSMHSGFFVNFAMEVSTDLGHMIAIGLKEYVGGIRKAETLRRVMDNVDGFVIVAHPFRHAFDPVTSMRSGDEPFNLTPEQAAELPVFQLVDAIEVANACNTTKENEFAHQVAQARGLPGTGGSDAHSSTGIGNFRTGFEQEITTPEHFLEELQGGRFQAVHLAADGRVVRFEPGSVAAVQAEAAGS